MPNHCSNCAQNRLTSNYLRGDMGFWSWMPGLRCLGIGVSHSLIRAPSTEPQTQSQIPIKRAGSMAALAGKVAVITGGAGSLGLATARLFLAEGAWVMLVDLRESDLAHASGALASPDVATFAADVTRAAEVAAFV